MSTSQKGGAFLIEDPTWENIFVPEQFGEDADMVRQMVIDFVEKEVAPRGNNMDEQVPLLEQAAALGLLGTHMPESYGGSLLDTNTNTLIGEEMGKGNASFSTTFAAHTGIGMLPILYFGTEEQRARYLPGLIDGSLKASYCLTEPESGSDALAAKSKAILSEDGKYYLLNGQKMWITNAGFSDILIVFAQIDGDKFTGFIVEKNSEGISLGAEEHKLGIKGSSTRQIFFENVKVPAENVLGVIGKGHLIAFNVLNIGRFKLGVLAMGGSKKCISAGTQYANERQQFKQPISAFGAIQYKLAESAIRAFVTESAVYRVSDLMEQWKKSLMDSGSTYVHAMLEAAEEYSVECAIIKIYGSETLFYVIDELVQIHGGNGFSEEFMPAGLYRDNRINRIYEGTNEINRMLMVNMILRKALKGELNLTDPAWAVQKELASMPKMEALSGDYASEKRSVKDYKKMTLMVAGAAVKYQMDGKIDLKNEQEILMNTADMMIDVFNAESVLNRVEKLLNQYKSDKQDIYDAILKVYMHDAQARLVKNATDALASFATGDELKIMLMGIKRFSRFEAQNVKELRRKIAKHLIDNNSYQL